jgi:hypothetical protein
VGADFYPIYSTRLSGNGCRWQLCGPYILFTTNTFGGTSAAEYGGLQASVYPASNGLPQYIFDNFHNTLSKNPCPATGFDQEDDQGDD